MQATAGDSHSLTASCLADVGRVLEYQGRMDEAEGFYRESLVVSDRVGRGETPFKASTSAHLGRLLVRTGRAEQGEPMLRESLGILREVLGEKHPRTSRVEHDLGSWLADSGREREALPVLAMALATREAAYPPGHVDIAWTRLNRELAVAALDKVLPPDHPERARFSVQ
jgi:eukaryotic-like serine/threonine-protein kinase